MKVILLANLDLIQDHQNKEYSNLSYIQLFMAHVDEFENTRMGEEESRSILFPAEVASMFGIAPVKDNFFPSTEALECLIEKLSLQGKFETLVIGDDDPYIQMKEDGKSTHIFLKDTPRLRQLYYDYRCFRSANVRLESLNYALKYIRSRKVNFYFLRESNLREIIIQNRKMIFVYEYCLSQLEIRRISPEEDSVIVNLHNWNGESSISPQAYEIAKNMRVKLLTMKAFYEYIREIQ